MMLFLKRLCKHLNSNQETLFGKLKPEFQIFGSIPEGTRIGKVEEIDAMCHFLTLEGQDGPFQSLEGEVEDNPIPLDVENALTLKTENSDHPLPKYCINNRFRFDDFMGDMMQVVAMAMNNISMPEHLSIPSRQYDESCDCQMNPGEPMSHCVKCIRPVTFTKSGVCIILKWKDEDIVNIDLIPVFPVKYREDINIITEVFNMLINDLIEKRPPNWLDHLKKVVKADRILPEFYEDFKTDSKGNNNSSKEMENPKVGLKMLHFYSENNFVIRPSQILNIGDFSRYHSSVKEVYFRMKYLKTALNVDFESYMLKKIVLRGEFLIEIEKGGSVEDHLYEAMNYHPVKKAFEGRIDYQKWKRQKDEGGDGKNIPIKIQG